jgi:hypothetical protein
MSYGGKRFRKFVLGTQNNFTPTDEQLHKIKIPTALLAFYTIVVRDCLRVGA